MDQWVGITGSVASFALGFFADPIREQLFAPKLEMAFGAGEDFLSRSPELLGEKVAGSIYARVRIVNRSFRLARACRVYLTNVEFSDSDTQALKRTLYCESVQLAWSVRDDDSRFAAQDLAYGVPYFADVLSVRADSRDLFPKINGPPWRYTPMFRQKGTFRFVLGRPESPDRPAQPPL